MKILACLLTLSLAFTMNITAQDNKEKLIDLITTSNSWMNGYMVDKLFTINLSPTMCGTGRTPAAKGTRQL